MLRRSALVSAMAALMVAGLGTSTSAQADLTFGEAMNLGPIINSESGEGSPTISADGLELYFGSDRADGSGGSDLWVSTRPSTDAEWGEPVNLGPTINGELWEHCPTISGDGLTLFFDLDIPGNLMMIERPTLDAAWGEPVSLGNEHSDHYAADLSADGSMLYFTSEHEGGQGDSDIWQVAIDPGA